MTKQDPQEIKKHIIAEITNTKQSIIDYKEMSAPEALDDAVGRVSRMDAINNKSITQAALRQAEDKLNKLEYVLTQIDKDEFGLCARCKKQIPIGRILLRPQSIFCVSCKEQVDNR